VLLTCFNPMSIFCAIPYTESLYLLLTALTLQRLVQPSLQPAGIALLGALSSATRPTGVVILPSILIAFLRRRRPAAGLVVCLVALGGLAAVALLDLRLSGDPLAFLHAQQAWEVRPGFNLSGLPFWLERFSKVFLGPLNTRASALIDGVHPALMAAIAAVAAGAVGLRRRHGSTSFVLSLVAFLAYWLVAGMSGLNLLVTVGALLLCGWGLGRLPLEVWSFAAASLVAYLLKQHTMSLERHLFATAPLLILHGAWFSEHPRWLHFLVGFGALLLVIYALRFASGEWIG
jgi:Gpi18-like mannosyltransferase